MKLREITIRENDEYAGLEDADEFDEFSYVVVGGRLPWYATHKPKLQAAVWDPSTKYDPDKVIPEIEEELTLLGSTLGMTMANTDSHTIGDGHGGHIQYDFYFHSENPYQNATKIRKILKRKNYLIRVPSGRFDVDFIDVYNP